MYINTDCINIYIIQRVFINIIQYKENKKEIYLKKETKNIYVISSMDMFSN